MSARALYKAKAVGSALLVAFFCFMQTGNAQSPMPQQGVSSDWQAIVDAAKREGALRIAGHPSDLRRAAFVAFQESYPDIKVEYVSIGSHGQADGRLKAEWEANVFNWDVLASGEQFIYDDLIPKGALLPIHKVVTRPDVIADSAWRNGFDSGFMDKERAYVFGFMTYIAEIAFVNTDVYPLNEFKSVKDLLDPKFKGKIAWVDPRTGGVPDIMTAFVYQRLGEDGLRALLTKQEPQMVGTSRQLLEVMLRGGKPIGIGVTTGTLRQMSAAGLGASIKRIDFPDGRNEGRSGGFIAIPKAAPHPNAARVFATWLLSRDGQNVWVKLSKENSARLDVPVADPDRYPDPKLKWYIWDTQEAQFFQKYQLPARKIVSEILGSRK